MTATSPPTSPEDSGFAAPPPPYQEERRSFTARRGFVLAIIVVLAVLLVATSFETGMLGSPGSPTVNTASTPLTGQQLYSAYASNEAQATASYTNKTVYIQDSLDFGVATDRSTGQFYSSVNSGTVILLWSSTSSQVANLVAGATVLAKCSVEGVGFSPGSGYVILLQNCDLIKVQSQASTTSVSVSAASV